MLIIEATNLNMPTVLLVILFTTVEKHFIITKIILRHYFEGLVKALIYAMPTKATNLLYYDFY